MSDEKVTPIRVLFKAPPDERQPLKVIRGGGCDHRMATYQIREGEAEVECGRCGVRLDPMWVLMRLATEDQRLREYRKALRAEEARYAERTRTKCEHCNRMTRISRRG